MKKVTYLGIDKGEFLIFDGKEILHLNGVINIKKSKNDNFYYQEGKHEHPFIHLESEQQETLYIPL